MMETPFYDEDHVNLFTLKEAAPIAQAALLDCTLVKKDTAAAKLLSLNSPMLNGLLWEVPLLCFVCIPVPHADTCH